MEDGFGLAGNQQPWGPKRGSHPLSPCGREAQAQEAEWLGPEGVRSAPKSVPPADLTPPPALWAPEPSSRVRGAWAARLLLANWNLRVLLWCLLL